jgi:hypothetical protein
VCEVLPLAAAHRFFNLATPTIEGIVTHVMPNAIINPRTISIQDGKEIENILADEFNILGIG